MNGTHRAKRLPKQPGPAAWNAILPPRPATEPLTENTTADFVVIGAGIAGLSAARRLAQADPSARIVVVEAGRVAEGPAGRNSGFMIDLPHDLSSSDYAGEGTSKDAIQIDLNRRAIRFATDVAQDVGLPTDYFDPCGKINGAATEAGDHHNRTYADHLGSLGEDHSLLDAVQMRDLTGTDHYQSGLYTPGTVMLQPAGYVRGLSGALGSDVRLFENSPVRSFTKSGTGWTVECDRAAVSAQSIILAVNGHAESFGFFSGRLLHVFTYASMSRPFDPARLGGSDRWGITPADPMGATLRRVSTAEGTRIVVRTRFTCNPSMQVGAGQIEAAGRLHDSGFRSRFPRLEDVEMEYRWAGHLCLSRNGVSAFGEIDEGVYSACCQNGLGLARGTLSGMAAADLAAGVDSVEARSLLDQEAPSRLPPAPVTWLGANAVMRWKEWRAGREC